MMIKRRTGPTIVRDCRPSKTTRGFVHLPSGSAPRLGMMPTVKVIALVAGLLCAAVGCGGSGSHIADPFRDGVAGGRVAADAVICDPTPSMCTRYVVLAPASGTAQTQLMQAAVAVVQQELGWTPSRTTPVPAWQGLAFDGKSAGDGGFINAARVQLAHSYGDLDAGASAKTGTLVMAAMRANPTGVIVRIMRNG